MNPIPFRLRHADEFFWEPTMKWFHRNRQLRIERDYWYQQLEAAEVATHRVREALAKRIEGLGAVVFCGDDKGREMLPKSVVLTVIRNAPLTPAESAS